jgi:hypothetical protein
MDFDENRHRVRFWVLTSVSMKTTAFLDIAWCSPVEVDRRFSRGAYCFHESIVLVTDVVLISELSASFNMTISHCIPEDSHLQDNTEVSTVSIYFDPV